MICLKPFTKRKNFVLYLTEIVFTEHIVTNRDSLETVYKERTPCFIAHTKIFLLQFSIFTASSKVLGRAGVKMLRQWIADPVM
jgi:hypothetical protein